MGFAALKTSREASSRAANLRFVVITSARRTMDAT